MKKLYKILFSIFILSGLFSIGVITANAEKIYLKDGKVLDEKISHRSRGVVWYNKSSGAVGINEADIEKIESSDGSVSKYDYKAISRSMQDCIREGKYVDAITLCSTMLEMIPDNMRLRYLRGILSQKVGNFIQAEEDYKFLVDSGAADAAILNNLGTIYAGDEKYKEAADLFIKAAAENPDMIQAHDNLAQMSLQAGDSARAVSEYEKVLAREPDNINALYNLGMVYMGKKDFDKAKSLWEKALSVKPEDEDAKSALKYLEVKKDH